MLKIIENHIRNNLKEYTIVLLIFILGLLLGIAIVNNSSEEQKAQVENYMNEFTDNIKGNNIDYNRLLISSIKSNFRLVIAILFFSISLIGIPIVYGILGYQGFKLGYTLSSMIIAFGSLKGSLISISLLLLTKIITIPAIIFLTVEGIKLCKNIVIHESKNIKYELFRFIIISIFILIILAISSLIETYICSNLLVSLIHVI